MGRLVEVRKKIKTKNGVEDGQEENQKRKKSCKVKKKSMREGEKKRR